MGFEFVRVNVDVLLQHVQKRLLRPHVSAELLQAVFDHPCTATSQGFVAQGVNDADKRLVLPPSRVNVEEHWNHDSI